MQLPWQKPKIPVLALRGIIAPRPGAINLEAYTAPIERAFVLAKKSKNLVLAVESPGGSAVQSDLIGQFLLRRAKETGVAITAVIGDVGASGGYWLACAGAKIYANRLSIVGSIGVVTGGFGLDQFIARHGIERRIFTAGEHKRRLDMFAPLRAEDEAFTRELLEDAHGMFKAWVSAQRGERLTAEQGKIFDGGYMLGERALSLGLIDGFGDVDSIVKQLGGKNAKPLWVRPKPPRGIMRFITRGAMEAAMEAAEERLSGPRLR